MPIEPSLVQWITALLLLAVFAWVLVGLVLDIVSLPGIRADKPQKKNWDTHYWRLPAW